MPGGALLLGTRRDGARRPEDPDGLDPYARGSEGQDGGGLSSSSKLNRPFQMDWMSARWMRPGGTCNHDHEDGEHHHTSLDDLSDEDHLELKAIHRGLLDKLMATPSWLHL